jgi:hypothetical protein
MFLNTWQSSCLYILPVSLPVLCFSSCEECGVPCTFFFVMSSNVRINFYVMATICVFPKHRPCDFVLAKFNLSPTQALVFYLVFFHYAVYEVKQLNSRTLSLRTHTAWNKEKIVLVSLRIRSCGCKSFATFWNLH